MSLLLKQELAGLAEIVLEQGQTTAATSADEESVNQAGQAMVFVPRQQSMAAHLR